jgi:uncharacterized protein YndB with AHSA1/START domain
MQGRLEQPDGRWQVRFTRTLPHPQEKVWRALTEPEHLEAWFPTTIEGERKAGAKLVFSFTDQPFPPFEGEMVTFDPPSVMEFWWGDDLIRFELQPAGDATELTLIDVIDELGKAARDAAGWHTKLDVLEFHLRGEQAPPEVENRWEDYNRDYVEAFPPEAASIGPPEGIVKK